LRSRSSTGTSRFAAAMQRGDRERPFKRLMGRESVDTFLDVEDIALLLLLLNMNATSSIEPPSTAQ
jgi:hypothetical protein